MFIMGSVTSGTSHDSSNCVVLQHSGSLQWFSLSLLPVLRFAFQHVSVEVLRHEHFPLSLSLRVMSCWELLTFSAIMSIFQPVLHECLPLVSRHFCPSLVSFFTTRSSRFVRQLFVHLCQSLSSFVKNLCRLPIQMCFQINVWNRGTHLLLRQARRHSAV